MLYRFTDYILDTDRHELYYLGESVKLQRKMYQLLVYLVQHRDHLVTKHELLEQVWPEAYVDDSAVARCIRSVRLAVGDNRQRQQVIQTLYGQGYRFVAEVEEEEAAPDTTVAVVPLPAAAEVEALREAVEPPVSLGSAWGERKLVTVLCGALTPTVGTGTETDLDVLHELHEAMDSLIRRVTRPYEGTLQHLTIESFTVLFGAPIAQEAHATCAALAALALQQSWSLLAEQLRASDAVIPAVSLGLHTGLVVLETLVSDPMRPITVVGDALQRSEQLAQRASPGSILASAATAHPARDVIHLEAISGEGIDGQSTSTQVYHVLERRIARSDRLRHDKPGRFVGRQAELAMLHAKLAQVQEERGQTVAVVGEAGIGKSRLVREFWRSAPDSGLNYLMSSCNPYGHRAPYLLVYNLVMQLCGLDENQHPSERSARLYAYLQDIGMASDEWVLPLLHILGLSPVEPPISILNPQDLRAITFTALHQLFLLSSRREPLVLVVESVHWIDATSEAYLTELVERLTSAPLLLLVTYRSGYHPPWLAASAVTQIALSPLSRTESQQLIQVVLPVTWRDESVSQEIMSKAQGNPFFLEELAQAVVEQGDRVSPLAVPDTIQVVLAARIDRLAPEAKDVLLTAAVIGIDFTLSLLQAVALFPEETLHEQLRALQSAEFLYVLRAAPEPVYTFKHALTQEVVYQSLLRQTREQIHGQVAEVIVEQMPELVAMCPELVAYHYTESGLTSQALIYWRRAGEQAIARSAHTEAVDHFSEGLRLLRELPDAVDDAQQELTLQVGLGVSMEVTKGYAAPEVEQAFTRARSLCREVNDSLQLFAALRGLWRMHLARSELRRARELGQELLQLAHGLQDSAYDLQAHLALGQTFFFLGKMAEARDHLEQAIASYDRQQHRVLSLYYGADPGVQCLSYAAAVLWHLGYPERASQQSQKALALAEQLAHPFSLANVLYWIARLHQCRRETTETQERAEELIVLSTESTFAFWRAGGLYLRGWALVEQGDREEGMAHLRQGLSTTRSSGAVGIWSLALLAEACGKMGQVEEAWRLATEALTLIDQTEEECWAAEIHRLRGEFLLLEQDGTNADASFTGQEAETAEMHFIQALDVARSQQAKSLELRAAMSLSRLWRQEGKLDDARQLLAEVYKGFTEGFDTADLQEAKALLEDLRSYP